MHSKKTVLITCMDARHEGAIGDAIREAINFDPHMYLLTEPGGAGVLAGIFPEAKEWLLKKLCITIDKLGAEEIYLSVHGVCAEDMKGCGGYALEGHGDNYADPARSRDFSHNELRKAAAELRAQGISLPVRAFYITFGPNGENWTEEVELEG